MDTTDTIVQIPLDQLQESPFNPRKVFTGIDELAQSILAEGRIHQPLLVRPIIGPLFGSDPTAATGHEIVFGHRRYRAAQRAGLATVPCMVRAMTDAEVRSAQAVENLQRENIQAFEEAEGYQAMMAEDKLSAEDVAVKLGKSTSHVYARLKLLQAIPRVRQACEEGKFGAEVALLVARLRTPQLQEKALARIKACNIDMNDGGQKSFRHIRAELAEHFTLRLKEAIFDREDAELLPGAGVCSSCPKRSGNAPEFQDLATENVSRFHGYETRGGGQPELCTDPDCWAAKKAAHLKREAGKLEALGLKVVQGSAARQAVGADGKVKGGFVALADSKALLAKAKLKDKSVKAPDVPAYSIQNPRDGKVVRAVRLADLQAAGLVSADQKLDTEAARHKRDEAQRAKLQSKIADVHAQRLGLLRHVRDVAAGRELGVFELRMAAAAALQGVGWNDRATLEALYPTPAGKDVQRTLQQQIDSMDAPALTRLLLDCLLVDNVRCTDEYQVNREPGPLLALARHYRVDAEAVMQASALPPEPAPDKGTPTPSRAGAGAKKSGAAPAKKGPARAMAFRCPDTGMTWTGRGLQPAWLRAALAQGKTLESLRAAPEGKKVKDKASSAGNQVKDDAGSAGDQAQMGLAEEEAVSA
jgi:ParB/RepB/Spo0J family partition protein